MEPETLEKWFSAEAATFGDRLAGAREAAGLTQRELAERLGVRLKTLQAWEDDLAEPRANRLQMLAGMLSVSLMWLLTGEGDGLDGPPEARAQARLASAAAELRALRGLAGEILERLARLEARLGDGGRDG